MVDMSDKMKENFEAIKERIEEHKDDFAGHKDQLAAAIKGAKEGWESAAAEDDDKQEIAKAEETHQTH